MKVLAPQWKFFVLPPPFQLPEKVNGTVRDPDDKWYHLVRHGGGMESGVHLFASLELARQCSGFVGHMGSGATMMFYQYMCVQHNGLRFVCPPKYDLRDGL